MECRVTIQWTQTAKDSLKELPKKVRKGLFDKADELQNGGDPRENCKALTGPLQGCYRLTYGRYRLIFSAEEEQLEGGGILLHVKVIFLVAGIRKEFDKNDVYRVAQKLVDSVLDDRGLDGGDVTKVPDKPESRKKKKKT